MDLEAVKSSAFCKRPSESGVRSNGGAVFKLLRRGISTEATGPSDSPLFAK